MKAYMFPMLRDDFQLVETYKVSDVHLHLPGGLSPQSLLLLLTHRGDHHMLVQHVVESTGKQRGEVCTGYKSVLQHRGCSARCTSTAAAPGSQCLNNKRVCVCVRVHVRCMQPSNPAERTTVPITAIGGTLDKRYTQDQVCVPASSMPKPLLGRTLYGGDTCPALLLLVLQVAAWSQHTTGGLTEVWLDQQGHNYIADCPPGLIAMLRMELQAHHIAAAATSGTVAHAGAAGAATSPDAAAAQGSDVADAPHWRRCCCTA